jgi:hypothetical protein
MSLISGNEENLLLLGRGRGEAEFQLKKYNRESGKSRRKTGDASPFIVLLLFLFTLKSLQAF